jgi:uncharacterized protein YjbI with pentapeptide repeats
MQKLSAEELLAQYDRGKRDFHGFDLSEISLFQANLPGINLSESNLTMAYFP